MEDCCITSFFKGVDLINSAFWQLPFAAASSNAASQYFI